MAYEKSARRFRPVGSRKKKAAPQYSPAGTGCPVVEQAVERLYREQNETHFWNLMNALNYALELKTRVLVPLDAAADPQSGPALFTSVKTAEAERATATRPMAERGMREAMEYALNTDGIDGVVIDPWTNSATLDGSILNGLLKSERGSEGPGLEELDAGYDAARQGSWAEAVQHYEKAVEAGSAEALALLGDCLYQGRGARRSKVQARRMWKKAAKAGEVQAMIALGDDAAASGQEAAAALQYYRRAQSAARGMPDVSYTPQIRLRIAQCETRYVSRKKALMELAEAEQGFCIQLEEGAPDAEIWLDETRKTVAELMNEGLENR